eukprot:CAMPEP_0201567414 /NCGR_PEP_ID=MMETSP0190_2-20130828/7924_1 /ASSEMBLY_ACC=CAM_ASM_000263 /TAXON_ID=37353 /ORGANISM="Rosalina sp." /LENGTH=196 /DNA_ID=CAMNT_0047987409 /DNA_START=86 /DNA_END=676 /DNA_ORIENTATION=-
MAEKTAHKIVVLGAGAVGKSAITIRMVANEWRKEYDPTIEDSYTCVVNVDGKNEQLDILDTAGQEQFAALQDHWIREAEAFVLVYSVQSQRTFKHADDLHKKILRNKDGQRIDMILVGNKSDLPMNEHQVTFDMGKQLADSWNVPFMETSAKTGDNVYESFELLIKQIYKDKPDETGSETGDIYNTGGSGCGCTIL